MQIYLLKGKILYALLLGSLFCAAQPKTAVPFSRNEVLVDGMVTDAEWKDAFVEQVTPTAQLFIKQTPAYLYIAVRYTDTIVYYSDLFLEGRNDTVLNFHASMQVALRKLLGREWNMQTPSFQWGRQEGWAASQYRKDQQKEALKRKELIERTGDRSSQVAIKEVMYPANGQEYQISKSLLPSGSLKFMVQIRDMEWKRAQPYVFPASAELHNTGRWKWFNLKQ